MNVNDFFLLLKNEIHSTVFATIDEKGFPHTCVIDIMLCDDKGLYFITSKGKKFYQRLLLQNFVSISGMKGNKTLSSLVVSVRGKVKDIGHDLVDTVFLENPYMEKIYPTKESKKQLTVFQLYQGEGEFFDLTTTPPFRQAFSFGGVEYNKSGYFINNNCTQCNVCKENCPSHCIIEGKAYKINQEHCIHCGTCFASCRFNAIEKL